MPQQLRLSLKCLVPGLKAYTTMGPLHSKLLIEFDSEMWRQRRIHPRHHGPIWPPDLFPFYPSSVLHHWGFHTRAVPWSHAQGVVLLAYVSLRRMYQGQWLCLGDEIRHRALSAETCSLCVVQVWNQKKTVVYGQAHWFLWSADYLLLEGVTLKWSLLSESTRYWGDNDDIFYLESSSLYF